MRLIALLIGVAVVLGSAHARGADPTLADRAAAIEQARSAPDGERVVLGHVSRELRMSAETLRTERAQTGLGWGDILIAHLLAKETGLAFDALVTQLRSGQSWEQIAQARGANLDRLRKEIEKSQEMVERRSEDRRPQTIQMDSGPLRVTPNPTSPQFDPKPKH